MKVLGINGSSRKNGNTALIIKAVFEELEKENIQTEMIQFSGNIIEPCKGCFACKGKCNCVFKNDMFYQCFEKMKAADGVILGSPVYSADITANMKAFLERAGVVVATNSGLLKHKVGVSISAVRRGGGMTAVDTMNHFLLNKEMIVMGSSYWNMVYGKNVGDVYHDEEGINNMHNLGENMAWILKKINQ